MRTLLFLSVVILPYPAAAEEVPGASFPLKFSTRGIDGAVVELKPDSEPRITVVCFLGAECPLARLYGPRLQKMADELSKQNVHIIGIGSNRQDSADDLKDYVASHKIRFPFVKDYGNRIADQFHAERTPEVFVLDQFLQVRYRGRIDNEFEPGVKKSEATVHDLKQAVAELLAGKPVSVPRTKAVGCIIGRRDTGEVKTEITYAKEISRVLRQHCVECHQPGEIGPFALTEYDEVVGWAEMMMEVIDNKRMPPWNADPDHGEFSNARDMPERDKQLLREWVNGGMPFGEIGQLPPPLPNSDQIWQLAGEPDLVLPMAKQPFRVPADEFVEYQYYVVDPGFEKDTWVTGAEVLPGNRSVVHHCIVFIRPPDGSDSKGIGWLTAYVPGQRIMPFPQGYGRMVPAGSRLVFQMHYTPTGTEEEDITRLGLWLGDQKSITKEVFTLMAINHDFEIPPHAKDFPVFASRDNLPENGELLAAAPHMHVRGKSFELLAETDKEKNTLLSVPVYDFNWQHLYCFKQPIPLQDIDKLSIVARFDNSSGNTANPDPTAFVTWGDQTFEEMAIGFFEVAVPRKTDSSRAHQADRDLREAGRQSPRAARKFAKDYFDRFDQNDDRIIRREELPVSIKLFGFESLDANADRQLTLDEIRRHYEQCNQE